VSNPSVQAEQGKVGIFEEVLADKMGFKLLNIGLLKEKVGKERKPR
jgi:hypothetical protein